MRVDGSSTPLIQGVSQQPYKNRLPGQSTEVVNYTANPVDGLTRRPALEEIGLLLTTASPVSFKFIDHSRNSQFIAAISESSVKVFDLMGDEKTVVESGTSMDYITSPNVALTTKDNKTYIADRDTVCAMLPDTPLFIDYGCIVYVKAGNYSKQYSITVRWKDAGIGGTERSIAVTHLTADGSSAVNEQYIRTTYIATILKNLLDATTTNNFNTTFDVVRVDDVLYIQWKPATLRADTFTVTTSDDFGGTNMIGINNSVKKTSDLPKYAPHGYHITVTGEGSAAEDDYYLEFSVTADDTGVYPALGAGFGKPGIWIETVKNKIPYLIDRETMPHILEYLPDTDSFTFSEGTWEDRLVGDDTVSNEDPSFIGEQINDLSYFQGRLVILAGSAVIMSRTDKPLDFWIKTATTQTDSDSIDMESTAEGVGRMIKGVPHNRDFVVFADGGQFVVFGRNQLTPKNASLVLTTKYKWDPSANPVTAGKNVLFPSKYGKYVTVNEFYTEGGTDINDAQSITGHVLKYIVGPPKDLVSSSDLSKLALLSGDMSNTVYIYEYLWAQDKRVQSAWGKWLFADSIEFCAYSNSNLYIVYRIGNNYYLGKIDHDVQDDQGMNYNVRLDRKKYIDLVNTEFNTGYIDHPSEIVVIQGEGCPNPGMQVEIAAYNSSTGDVELDTDLDGGVAIVGVRYTSYIVPTNPVVKDRDNVAIGTGSLIVKHLYANLTKSGRCAADIISRFRDTVTVQFTGRRVGDPLTVVGEAAIVDSVFDIPFGDSPDNAEYKIYTDSHEPLTITDIEWVGQYNKRGQRITQGKQ